MEKHLCPECSHEMKPTFSPGEYGCSSCWEVIHVPEEESTFELLDELYEETRDVKDDCHDDGGGFFTMYQSNDLSNLLKRVKAHLDSKRQC